MTQKDTVLKHLKRYTTITPLEAFHVYGIYRLAAVIEQLRKAGLDITTKMKTAPNGSRYAEYRLKPVSKEVVRLPVPSAQRDMNIPSEVIEGARQSMAVAGQMIRGGAA